MLGRTRTRRAAVALVVVIAASDEAQAQADAHYRGAPILYGAQRPADPVATLDARLAAGDLELRHEPGLGYLRALLAAAGIPASSQGLVFSKTSFQHQRISPQNPRAVYFGDEVYVGYVPGGQVLEITAMDPVQGPIFYTLDQSAQQPPRFARQTDACLTCHASQRTGGWPGHLVRSVFADHRGHPLQSAPSFVTTHASPLHERWGGWYVTGQHGGQRHMGNATLAAPPGDAPPDPAALDRDAGANAERLPAGVAVARYPTPHSDLVALMVLEHQAHVHNVLARASYTARQALHQQQERRAWAGASPEDDARTRRRIHDAADEVLAALLLRDEARLTESVRGTSAFAAEFAAAGRRDGQGRSLRDLDLEQRLFRHPCSYLIHSPSFDALPAPVLDVVYTRLWRILTGRFGRRSWSLTRAQRQAILDILLATKTTLPDSWHAVDVR